nr:T9SS type A sorting domain-containing protein [uncultured Flavobacterium sp.]
MRKITFTILGLLFTASGLLAQTFSTGTVTFFGGGPTTAYSGKVDVTSTTATVTLIGPSTSWLGIAFNVSAPNQMDNIGSDVLIFDGTNMTDRSFDGIGVTPPTDTQNWTVQSNNISSGVRTVVATRARVATEGTDFTFPFSAGPLPLTFARGTSLVVTYHGSGNCGSTTSNLGNESFAIDSFKMYPNPTKNFVNIELPELVAEASVIIYDMLGKKVKEATVTFDNTKVDLTGLTTGSYLMNIKTKDGEGTKTLVIN